MHVYKKTKTIIKQAVLAKSCVVHLSCVCNNLGKIAVSRQLILSSQSSLTKYICYNPMCDCVNSTL